MRKIRYIILLVGVLVLMVAVKPIQAAVTLLYFQLEGSATQITIEWETASEIDMIGFYLLKSTQPSGTYDRISDLILSTGDGISGAYYQYADTNVTQGNTYYYKLEVLDRNQVSEFFGPIAGYAGLETPTPTATNTQTMTTTSATQSITSTKTSPAKTPTPTRTRIVPLLPTSTRPVLAATRTRTQPPVPTMVIPAINTPEATPENLSSATETNINVTITKPEIEPSQNTQSPPMQGDNSNIWGWMLVGISGSVLIAGLGWLALVIFRHKQNK